jgi:NAD(P)-dependent dehydrogenase (short-subunit alcohol dehydrogenase family)
MRHAGSIAIVTGAGQGIGRAIAQRLAAEGAAIGVLDLDAAKAAEVAATLRDGGARAASATADIADFAEAERAIAALAAELGAITLLVNNVGYTVAGSLDAVTLEGWHREIDVNLNGTYHCIRAVIPGMKQRGGGIVNIASVNGLRYFGNPAYSAAKAGLLSLTGAVASEYGPLGIRCNAISPGSVHTENLTWTLRQQQDPDVFAKLARWYPLGRVAEPADIAAAVAFLGSAEAAYINGVNLPVDGGLLSGMNVMIEDFILEDRHKP